MKDGRRENKVRASQVVRLMAPDEFLWEKKDAHGPGPCPCRDGSSNHRDGGWTERVSIANEEGEIPQALSIQGRLELLGAKSRCSAGVRAQSSHSFVPHFTP